MNAGAYYLRTSTTNQEDDGTIENQRTEVVKRAAEDGYEIPLDYRYEDDGYTGSILARPALDALRSAASNGELKRLYIYDRGRLSRIYVHQQIVIDELTELGVEVISLKENTDNSAEGQFMQHIIGGFHEYERYKISERFRLGKQRKANSGKLVGYNAPYGYVYHPRVKWPEQKDGWFEIREDEAKVVRMMFDWVGNEGIALNEVIRRLAELGIPPRKQKRGTWTKGPVRRLLANETYIGTTNYYKSKASVSKAPKKEGVYSRVKKTSRVARPKQDWRPAEVPTIVDKELFEAVQHRLSLNIKYASRFNTRNDYLLTGLVECPCGKTRTGEGKAPATYYRCTDRLSRFPLQRICHEPGINVTVLDFAVWEEIKTLIRNPQLVMDQATKWLGKTETGPSQYDLVKKQLEKVLAEEDRYTKAYGQGFMDDEVFQRRMTEVKTRKNTLTSKLAELKPSNHPKSDWTPESLTKQALAAISDMEFGDKKEIVRKLVDKVICTQKEATIWGHLPVKQQVGYRNEARNCRLA